MTALALKNPLAVLMVCIALLVYLARGNFRSEVPTDQSDRAPSPAPISA